MDVEGSGHGLSEILPLHLLEGTEKSQWKSIRLASAMDKIDTRYYYLNLQQICIILSIPVTRTRALFISQSSSVCPYLSSYHNSLQVHMMHASKCHHTHNSIYLHSIVHLCWCKCSVKSQMMVLTVWWRPNVTTFLMEVLSLLMFLYKKGHSLSYHPATIYISVIRPKPSLRSVTSEDSCNMPRCFHIALQGIYSCQHHNDVVWTDTTDLLKCYHDSSITHTLCCMSAITTEPLPGPSTRSNKTSTRTDFKCWPPRYPMRQGPLILVSSMWLTHPHNSGFNFICSGSWSNASDAPTLWRNTPCTATMSNCILNACKAQH